MRLLIITQKVDKNDPILGFFHGWVSEFSKKFKSIVVVCLQKGEFDLPKNVKVLSLGKEEGQSKIKYLWRFYKYILGERKNYDAVFVHMNQEYVLLGWKTWFILRKPVYMWRNHPAGNFLTDLAVFFSKKVFCTSKFSYTAKFKKTIIMPVGVDVDRFKNYELGIKNKNSILYLGRIAPIKKPDLLIEVLGRMKREDWTLSIVGDPLPKDEDYLQSLKKLVEQKGIENKVFFERAVSNYEAPRVFGAHEIFANCSSSGMYDKTIFEAMTSGCIILASNENLRGYISNDFIFKEGDDEELKAKLEKLLNYSEEKKEKARIELKEFASKHDLQALTDKLYSIINN